MNTAMLTISLALFGPVVLEPGIHETHFRDFAIPVRLNPANQNDCITIRLWVSEDQGKNWKKHSEIPSTGDRFKFTSTRDGLYWFAVQTVNKDGVEPAKIAGTKTDLKVYVNAAKRPTIRTQVAARPPAIAEVPDVQQLQRELKELRDLVNKLQKRIAELEKIEPPG